MKRYCVFALSMLMMLPAAAAQPGVFSTTTADGRQVAVTVINDNVIKVTNAPKGVDVPDSRATVLKPGSFGGSAVTVGDQTNILTATGVTATLNSKTGAVTISNGINRAIADNGVRTTANGKQSLSLATTGNGSFYGAGERGHSFNLTGDTLVMYNKQNYGYVKGEKRISQMGITMPLFLSSNGYAIVFDDYAAAEMIMSNPIQYVSEGRFPISYYFVNGADDGSLKSITKELSALTGRQELPPFWALGYTTSKYGYKTQAETTGVIDTLKMRGYPVDGVVLDLYWYGKEEDMGRLAWDKDQWPDHKKMLSDLKKRGVNTIAISQPYILQNGRGVDNYNDFAAKGLMVKDSVGGVQPVTIWVGHGGMFDVSNPDTRQWLANRYSQLTDEGMGGWWGDLGEPEVHPETGYHANGLKAREYHNQYGNDWSQIIYDLYKEKYPNTRLMTLMRAGTTGLQRYSVFPWSTDVSRSWGGLQPQITIMLSSGLSGMGYMSHDVGGFAVDPENPTDPELYVRWCQLGLFSPILRTHAQQVAEPYRYPAQEHILKQIILDRYRWLPYNYTLAWENASAGEPLVRPLNYFSAAGDTRFDNIEDQYLWGSDIMVAPVMTKGATSRDIVVPDGTWLDYNNPAKVYNGGDIINNYPAPLEVLPLFVRGGAFIPMADYKMGNTGDYNPSRYTINYYPTEGESSGKIFEDDRKSTRSLQENAYAIVNLKGNATPSKITINLDIEGNYNGMPQKREIGFVVHNVDRPKSVLIDGKKAKSRYNAQNHTLSVSAKIKGKSAMVEIEK